MKRSGVLVRAQHVAYMEWHRNNPEILADAYRTIPGYSKAYLEAVFTGTGTGWRHQSIANLDYSSPYLNIRNGLRATVGVPETCGQTVHCFGDSRMFGVGVEDAHTLPSQLQALATAKGLQWAVVNYGVRSDFILNIRNAVVHATIRKNDLIVIGMPALCIAPCQGVSCGANYALLHKYGPYVARDIQRFCHAHRARVLFFVWPDLRRVREKTRHEKRMLAQCYGNKRYILLDDTGTHQCVLQKTFAAHGLLLHDMTPFFHRPHDRGELFWDACHMGPAGNALMTEALYPLIQSAPGKEAAVEHLSQQYSNNDLMVRARLAALTLAYKNMREHYFARQRAVWEKAARDYCRQVPRFAAAPEKRIGAIVMNGNPFTLGHKYLIDTALTRVDALYIFIVEEDRSFFPFAERFALVSYSYKNEPRVKVVPSGKLILSSITFPEYFVKDEKVTYCDPSHDIELFASVIAPALHITMRFVGTEPNCPVTARYNESIHTICTAHGLEVVELERLTVKNQSISATTVRKALQEQDIKTLRRLVPPLTYELLLQKYLTRQQP